MRLSWLRCVKHLAVIFNCLTSPSLRQLTLSPLIRLRLYILPYWYNPPFLIFDIWALWHSWLSARAPKRQKFKMVGMVLDPSNSSSLEQLALKGLIRYALQLPVTFHAVHEWVTPTLTFWSQNFIISSSSICAPKFQIWQHFPEQFEISSSQKMHAYMD